MKKILTSIILSLVSSIAFATPVNINTADAITISDSIKGIGLAKAQAIVDYREQHGAFESADELVLVKGIGTRTVHKIRADILLTDDEVKTNNVADEPQLSDAQ